MEQIDGFKEMSEQLAKANSMLTAANREAEYFRVSNERLHKENKY